jgi:hypothetical protein
MGRTELTISHTIIYFFTIVVIISLVLLPSLAAAVNKPSEIPAGPKTTEAPPVKETKDDQGNTIMSGEEINRALRIATIIKKEIPQEEQAFERGFFIGYYATLAAPKLVQFAIDKAKAGLLPKSDYWNGYILGVNAALPLRDTLEVLMLLARDKVAENRSH